MSRRTGDPIPTDLDARAARARRRRAAAARSRARGRTHLWGLLDGGLAAVPTRPGATR
jgi:hypothetical protein